MPPSQIVPKLADKGLYIASESTFYRILRVENIPDHRINTKPPQITKLLPKFIVAEPNRFWTWEITWLNTYTEINIFLLMVSI